MTTGEYIHALIKRKFKSMNKAAIAAGIPAPYVAKIVNNKLRSGAAYNSLLKTLGIPHEILVFMTFSSDKLEDKAQREIMEKILPGVHAQFNLVFDSKID